MRTTIRLDDQLFAEVKLLAAESGRTLTAVVEDALREVVSRRKEHAKAEPVRLIRAGLGGLQPRVNLDSNAELLDLMEGTDAVD